MKLPLAIISAFILIGCVDEKALIQKFAPKEDDEFARRFVELIRNRRYEEADPMLDSTVAAQAGANGLSQLQKIVDHGDPVAVELIGANVGFFRPWDGSGSKRQSNLTYQLQFRDTWVVVALVVESDSKGRRVSGANFQPVPDSLQVLNRFTFKNKSAIHYFFFLACILIPLFIIVTMVFCIRSRVRRRWMWIIFILLGICRFNLNWSTGEWNAQLISVMLLGSAWFRASSYSQVIVSFGIPVGALAFWVFRHRLQRKDETAALPTPPPT